MEYKKISELAKQIRGVSYKPDDLHEHLDEDSVILLRANNISNGKINLDDVVYVDKRKVAFVQYLRHGDILVCASSGSKQLVGKAASFNLTQACTFGAFCKVVRPVSDMADYLGAYFQSEIYRRQITDVAIGANINNIRNEHIDNMILPIRTRYENQTIVDTIMNIQKIIDNRSHELEMLDTLVKARFVEMFGDPQINPFGWAVVNISEVVGGKVSNGFFAKRDDYVDDGNVSILGVANIVNRMYSKVDGLPKTDADDKDIEKYEVRYGDILFCRSSLVAEGIGKASIIPENVQDKVLFECHVIRLPLDLNRCVPEFIQTLSTTDFFRNQVIAQSKTATMTTIGQEGILKTDIILPPVDKQREFYDFVKQVNKSKAVVQKSLDETQVLFDSLMQKYFG